ncbi:MAG: hypothetical protein KGJ32_11225 [Xanthomonadaceae bacterium]|nr:hypothetical protein [Xanthomonadaceae bacterium]
MRGKSTSYRLYGRAKIEKHSAIRNPQPGGSFWHAGGATGQHPPGQGECRARHLRNGRHQFMHEVIAAVLRFFLESLLVDLVWGVLLFNLGLVLLWLLTLGRYPRGAAVERHANRISRFGLLLVVIAVAGVRLLHGQPS